MHKLLWLLGINLGPDILQVLLVHLHVLLVPLGVECLVEGGDGSVHFIYGITIKFILFRFYYRFF